MKVKITTNIGGSVKMCVKFIQCSPFYKKYYHSLRLSAKYLHKDLQILIRLEDIINFVL